MAPPAAPPSDLQVLCRRLASLPHAQLPHALPSLARLVVACKGELSAPHDQKPRGVLVHKLKASITTLLHGRSREARFAAAGLVKAAVGVGGWEVLRGSEPWVRGLLSMMQVRHACCRPPCRRAAS